MGARNWRSLDTWLLSVVGQVGYPSSPQNRIVALSQVGGLHYPYKRVYPHEERGGIQCRIPRSDQQDNQAMISTVVLNWKRPQCLLEKVLPRLCTHRGIDEVILCHCNADTRFLYTHLHTDVVNLDYSGRINDTYGLSSRFLAALDAKNDSILFVDDDVLPTDDAVTRLYQEHLQNPMVAVGKWGRNPGSKFEYNYVDTEGPSAIVLTKFMMISKVLAEKFFEHSELVKELQTNAKPLWNGEDIFLSLVAIKTSGKFNIAYPELRVPQLQEGKAGIGSWRGHRKFRSKFVRIASRVLEVEQEVGSLGWKQLPRHNTRYFRAVHSCNDEIRSSNLDNPPMISVVVATRNRGAKVATTVKSILSNRYAHWELIVVDQSDNERTEECLQPFLTDARIQYLRSSTSGHSIGRNLGVEHAKGELIVFTDDDCEVSNVWLEGWLKAFASNNRIGMVFGNVNPSPHDPTQGFIPGYVTSAPFLARSLGDKYYVGGMGACMGLRRDLWEELGGFDQMLGIGSPFRAGEDTDAAVRALLEGYFVFETPEIEVVHHGFREWGTHGRSTIYSYWYSAGAMLAKNFKSQCTSFVWAIDGHSDALPSQHLSGITLTGCFD